MVDIVIVNWNAGMLLKKSVDSIISSDNRIQVNKIIIIDNHSSDNSISDLSQNEKILVINNAENLGFAKACNQGFRLCTAPFVLLLNPDTQLFNNTLENCVHFMKKNDGVDILGCQLLDDNAHVSPSCARFPSAFRIFIDAMGLSKIAPTYFPPAILMTDWDHLESRYVDQVMGAFMFMRLDIFEKVGYFDERFFVYYEELDFSYRLAKVHGKIFYNAGIKAIHTGMGTTETVKAFRLYLNLQSRLKYAKKHFSFIGYGVVFFSTFAIEVFSRLFFLIIYGRGKEIKDLVKGYKLLVSSLFKFKEM